MKKKRSVGVVLFQDFELLDVFGPLEMFGMFDEAFDICIAAEKCGDVASHQGPRTVVEYTFAERHGYDIVLVPGGHGVRAELDNPVMLSWLPKAVAAAEYVTTVCTGTALLAKAGLLNGRRATTNKMAFEWVASHGSDVRWEKQARWVEDGRFFTASGVSAGMDMTLALMEKLLGAEAARDAALWAEYERHADANWDPFASVHNLV